MLTPTRWAVAPFVALGMMLAAPATAIAASSTPPYTDPNAVGVIGLCDKSGQPITHGSTTTAPFVWRAVSSVAAAAPYNAAGRTATLYAYQPQQNTPPGDWSGSTLTGASRYSNPAHPMVAATGADGSLQNFIGQFHPMWDGLLQLRIYLGAPNQPTDIDTYAATDIKVTGTTWQVVRGGSVACNSGTSVSDETLLLPKSTTDGHAAASARPSAASSKGPTSSGLVTASPSTSSSSAGASGASAPAPATSNAAAQSNNSKTSGHHTVLAIVAVVLFVLLVAGGFLLARRPGSRGSA